LANKRDAFLAFTSEGKISLRFTKKKKMYKKETDVGLYTNCW
jgi:hypothetical protein